MEIFSRKNFVTDINLQNFCSIYFLDRGNQRTALNRTNVVNKHTDRMRI